MKQKNKSAEEIEKLEAKIAQLKEKIKKLEEEKEEYLDGWKRARAEHLNYIKEEQERIKKLFKIANEGLILKILPVLDSFKRAKEAISQDLKGDQIIQGFLQIENQIKEILKKEGLEEIEVKIGEKFNPEIHEAIGKEERKDLPPESIVEVVERGYKFQGKVIRPAKVKLSSKVEE